MSHASNGEQNVCEIEGACQIAQLSLTDLKIKDTQESGAMRLINVRGISPFPKE